MSCPFVRNIAVAEDSFAFGCSITAVYLVGQDNHIYAVLILIVLIL